MEQTGIIREAGEADIPAIAALHADLYTGFEEAGYYLPFRFDADALETLLEMQVKSKLCFVMVAEDAGEIVGFYTGLVSKLERKFSMEGALGYLNDMYIKPEHRKKGYAQRLLAAAQAWFAAAGVTVVKTDVLVGNENIARFLDKQAFSPMAVTYYKHLQE